MSERRSGAAADGVARGELVDYLDDYLRLAAIGDSGANGLQVEGRDRIRRLVVGVSACQELFVRARELAADAILVHHGLFWEGDPRPLVGLQYRRVAELIRAEISLLAYHLPLDVHPEVGNNAVAVRRLGATRPQPFAPYRGNLVGLLAGLPEPLTRDELTRRCADLFGREPVVFGGGAQVTRIAVVTGGGGRFFPEAIAAGAHAFITGEPAERIVNLARESGVAYLACGHYATETLGVRELGHRLAERFGLEVEFVDVPNPV